MRPLAQLIDTTDPGILLLNQWMASAVRPVEVLPPSTNAGLVLSQLQVTTRSMMGTLAYETGGVLIDHGWLRFLGSGHARLTRSLADWNLDRKDGLFLIADDVLGGFFGIRGQAGREVSYLSPMTRQWQPLGVGFSGLLQWAIQGDIDQLYEKMRWDEWRADIQGLQGDQVLMCHPPLWAMSENNPLTIRRPAPVTEAWDALTGSSSGTNADRQAGA